MYEVWRSYRGVMIERKLLDETSPDGRRKWMYTARVPGENPLYSRSQQGIKTQIGRTLNGLPPCDCGICIHRVPATPITEEHCAMDNIIRYPQETCVRFEVRS